VVVVEGLTAVNWCVVSVCVGCLFGLSGGLFCVRRERDH